MIITIDGPAAAGKGTLAGKLAAKYNLAYFDTGMVYRAVGLEMILGGYELNDNATAENFARHLTFPRMIELSKNPMFRSLEGSKAASAVAAVIPVREALLQMQQNFSKNPVFADGTPAKGAIYDGRDTGTVVCPQADIKFFVTASPEVRAERRYKEYLQKGQAADYQEVLEQTIARDKKDFARASSHPAKDAVIFDTSDLSIEEVFAKACEIIENRQKNLEK